MAAGQSFTAVQSIGNNGGGSNVYGKADIVGSNGLNANTSDPLFDRAVFRLPAQAIKRLRTTSGTVRNDYSFYVSNNVSFTTGGIATLSITDGTFDGSGVLSDAATRTDFYVVSRGYANTTTFSETLSTTNGSNTITSSATIDGKVNPGDAIYIPSVSNTFIVSSYQHVFVWFTLETVRSVPHSDGFSLPMTRWHRDGKAVYLSTVDCVKVFTDEFDVRRARIPPLR
jgi:hypothetical protein